MSQNYQGNKSLVSNDFNTLQVEKHYFHPLEEHRPWCPWVTEDEGMKGYHRITNSVKDVINSSEKNSNLSTMKTVSVFHVNTVFHVY